MANLPAPAKKSSLSPAEEKFRDLVTDGLAKGMKPGEIARRLAKGDKDKARKYRARIRYLSYNHTEEMGQRLAYKLKAEMMVGTGGVVQAVIKRGERGRIDAAKLIFEMTGLHNPKVQHEHSGEIAIKLDIARPPRTVDEDATGIVDADVVE